MSLSLEWPLTQVKREHYRALAHYYVALGLLDHLGELGPRTRETLQFVHDTKEVEDKRLQVPNTDKDRKYLGKNTLSIYIHITPECWARATTVSRQRETVLEGPKVALSLTLAQLCLHPLIKYRVK